MKCPTLQITHIWKHYPWRKGVEGQFMKNIHDGNSVVCKTHVFYSPTSTEYLHPIHYNKSAENYRNGHRNATKFNAWQHSYHEEEHWCISLKTKLHEM